MCIEHCVNEQSHLIFYYSEVFNTFIQQRCIKMLNCKHIYMLQKISI